MPQAVAQARGRFQKIGTNWTCRKCLLSRYAPKLLKPLVRGGPTGRESGRIPGPRPEHDPAAARALARTRHAGTEARLRGITWRRSGRASERASERARRAGRRAWPPRRTVAASTSRAPRTRRCSRRRSPRADAQRPCDAAAPTGGRCSRRSPPAACRALQVFYASIDNHQQPRGINGPLFTRKVCGGSNMNGALLNPDDFHGRNPLDAKPRKVPWQALVGAAWGVAGGAGACQAHAAETGARARGARLAIAAHLRVRAAAADRDRVLARNQVGGEHLEQAWPGNPLGLNVRVPTPVRKGDAYRSGTHYRSKHDPTQAPTNSTIGLDGSTIPGITNITGTEARSKVQVKPEASFGKILGSYKAEPSNFLLSHEKHPPLAFPTRFYYPEGVSFRLCVQHA